MWIGGGSNLVGVFIEHLQIVIIGHGFKMTGMGARKGSAG